MDPFFDRLLDRHEAARLLGVSVSTVTNPRWRRRTDLQAIRVGAVLRFKPDDIAALLERGRETFDQAQCRPEMQPNANAGARHESLIVRPPPC